MNLGLHFAYYFLLKFIIVIVVFLCLWRWKMYRNVLYVYPLTYMSVVENRIVRHKYLFILYIWRLFIFCVLSLVIMRPQLVDHTSKLHVDGVDIMMVLDVSGSMQLFDDMKDQRTRIEIVKQEAINFIKKRNNDPIGIVLFANDVVSRCPLTLDKKLLEQIMQDTQLGIINPEGTMLIKGLLTAISRLKKSQSKNRIIILLTDGSSTQGDFDPKLAVELAQKYGIKIYTIGVGSDDGGLFNDPLFGVRSIGMALNKQLLYEIAERTNGHFFEAKKPDDLNMIYDTIDKLEKTDYETEIYYSYYEYYKPFVWVSVGMIIIELILKTFVWFSI